MHYLTMKGRFEHTIMPVIAVFILLSVDFTESTFITSPIAYHIASFVDVSVSQTCTNDRNGNSCNDTCPSRTDFPSIADTPLTSKDSSCGNASGSYILANQSNGNINFKNGTNCTSVNTTVDSSVSGSFTFSIWLKIMTSYKSMLFSIGDQFSVTTDQSVLVIQGKSMGKVNYNTWTHVTLRNNGYLDVFISGQRFSNYIDHVSGNRTSKYELVIGPNKDLAASEVLDMADARWYQDVLTDREIEFLATGKLSKLAVESECRCPDTHPTLHKTSGDTRQRHILCEDRHGNITRRLNNDAHPDVYILDGDNNTYWNSGEVSNANITVKLGKTVQLKALVLYGLQPNRNMLTINLNGKTFTAQLNGNYTAVDFEEQFAPVENRTVYEKLVTDTVEISFEHSSASYFTVSEVEIHARCPCYGNDAYCRINSFRLNYSCVCNGSSHTVGTNCDTCKDEFYRKLEDTQCQYPCDCDPYGRTNNICSKVGGQCVCKSNVDNSTRACDRCNFNTINITSDVDKGCTECACNPIGIMTCMNDLTCVCKANVESDSRLCKQCLPNYYGIESETGCSPCGCNDVGTNETEPRICNMINGQCPCKRDVKGRTCNTCKDEYFNLDNKQIFGCESCTCNIVGRTNNICDKATGQCVCRQPVTGNINCKPANLQLKPDYGPVSGGTKIAVTGELLGDDTVEVRLTLSEKLDVEKKNDTVIVARTKRNAAVEELPLTIVWSKGGEPYESAGVNMKFTFKEDPTVTVPKEVIKTFASGGCAVDIFGENLDNVPEPELFIYTSNQNLSTSCSHVGSSQITCQTPNLAAVISDGEVTYGIGLDNIHDYNKFATSQTSIRIEPDPNVTMGEMIEFRNSFDDTITIKGTGLNTACRDSDVRILIDNGMCSLLSRTDTEITCDPEESFPGTSREATVMLYIGDMEVEVGKVTFISFWNTTEFYIIVGCVGGGILMIIAIIIAFCLCRRRRRQKINESIKRSSEIELTTAPNRRSNAYVTMESPAGSSSNPVAMVAPLQGTTTPVDHAKAFIKRLPTNVAKTVKTSIVDKSQIELGRMCTQKGGLVRIINGQFGSTSSSPFAGTNLTIKTLIDRYDADGSLPSWLADGLLECTRLRDCYNPNVLPLLGISIDDKHVYILYPEMSNRSLKGYMNNASRAFNQEKRLNICIQVAEGMNFLDAEHIVHKDLATRNCWVESNDMVKIGDAAFSWDLYPDEYSLQNDRYQPVRWMAPESLRQPGFYNSKTDVWSYGVFMWEVFTNGHLPYHDIEDDTQIKEYVCEAGYRLGKPHECTDIIYQVIEICHGDNSQGRPNFFIILNHLTEIMAGGNPTISYVNQQNFTLDEVDYMNFGQLSGMAH